MPKFTATINVTRVYSVVIEAPDEGVAESAAWAISTYDLHQHASLEYVETEHVEVSDLGDFEHHIRPGICVEDYVDPYSVLFWGYGVEVEEGESEDG